MIEGRPDQARERALDAMTGLESFILAKHADVEVHHEFARAAYVAAEACRMIDKRSGSGNARRLSLQALAALEDFDANEVESATLLAMLHALAGNGTEARRLMDRVLPTEYRAQEALYGSDMSRTMYTDRWPSS